MDTDRTKPTRPKTGGDLAAVTYIIHGDGDGGRLAGDPHLVCKRIFARIGPKTRAWTPVA